MVFAILIADNQLITMARMKKYFLHAADLHLLFNLVNSTESFKLSETWTPICLPKFDSRYIKKKYRMKARNPSTFSKDLLIFNEYFLSVFLTVALCKAMCLI